MCKYCCLRCSIVLVSQRGNAEGVAEAEDDPPREVVEKTKAVATARPRDRKYVEARRQAEIAARNKLSPGGKKVEEKHDLAFSKKEPLTSHRLRMIRRNERSSGSLCSATTRDAESARAGIGQAEAGERDPRRERAIHEGRGRETGGQRIPV